MSRYTWLVCFLVLILGSAIAAAQDVELTETQLFESGASFSFPEDWTVEANEGTTITVAGDLTSVTLADYDHFAGVAATGRSKSFSWYFNQTAEVDFVADDVEEVEVGGREALRYDYEDADDNGALMLLISFSDGSFGLVDAVSLDGALEEEAVVLAIAESFDVGESTTQTGGSVGEPCTLSTTEARTVRVRVGPGENRTSYTFLPANQSFEVLGQATADDDSLWWKLDREAVAPDAAANEAWIAQEDVQAEGDCGAVVDVNAPPIIPILAEPPPATDNGDTAAPPATGGLPQAGTWTIYYSSRSPASCIGDNVDSSTIWVDLPIPSETHALTVSGGRVVYGGQQLVPTGENRFRSQWDVPVEGEILSADARLILDSATQMHGEMQFTMSFGGVSCSITVSITVTKN